jgi:hypothetical protein
MGVAALCPFSAMAQPPRARDLGVPLEGTPGPLNALTDIAGIQVGQTTLIEGAGVRTGSPPSGAANIPTIRRSAAGSHSMATVR